MRSAGAAKLVDWSLDAQRLLEALAACDVEAETSVDTGLGVKRHSFQLDVDKEHANAVRAGPHGHLLGSRSHGEELTPLSSDVIITVMLCDTAGCKEQEYDVLASQTLHDLRDALYFVGDWTYDGPTRRSACMFIDGVFFSDMRDASAVDYAEDLIGWIKKTGHFLREESSRSMNTRFCDLDRVPFGEKCCYIRQGDIEHHMYFTGARLLNGTVDCRFREAYPCLIWMRRFNRRLCVACQHALAAWVVLDSSRCPFNPGYFCRRCFKLFSQDERGDYIRPVDYRVFPYLHD